MHQKFVELAIDLAIGNVKSNKGGPFGAIIVKNNKIISSATNSVIVDNDPSAHAEINAIRKACKELNTPFLDDCTIYSSCEPCPMCYAAIRWAKIENIYYSNTRLECKNIGFDDNKIYKEIIDNKQNMIKINPYNSKIPFLLWKDNVNKIEY